MKVSEHGWIYAAIIAAVVVLGMAFLGRNGGPPECCKKRGCECVEACK